MSDLLWPPFSVGVSVLVQDEAGRVLLQRRGDDGLWGTPGGGLDPGEDVLVAAQRELREETGLRCPDLRLLPLTEALVSGPEFFHRYPDGRGFFLVGARVEGTLPAEALCQARLPANGETRELRWFALGDLPPLSGNVNRATLNVLRARAGWPLLPLEPVSLPPTPPEFWSALRRTGGAAPPFIPGVSVLVGDGAGRTLLLRGAGSGRWTLPKRRLEPGESFEACARRGLRETGLEVGTLLPTALQTGPEPEFLGSVRLGVLYRANAAAPPLTPEARFFSTADFARLGELDAEAKETLALWRGPG